MKKTEEDVSVTIGRRLRQARLLRGLSQKQLGDEIGVSSQQIQKYEIGVNSIMPGKLTALAKAVGVTVHYFFDAPEPGAPTLPLAMESHRKLLHVVQALRQIEQRHPEVFLKICSMVTAIAKAEQPL